MLFCVTLVLNVELRDASNWTNCNYQFYIMLYAQTYVCWTFSVLVEFNRKYNEHLMLFPIDNNILILSST